MEDTLLSRPRQKPLQLRPRKLPLQPLKQRHDLLSPRHAAQHHLLGLGTARFGLLGQIPRFGQLARERRVAVGFGQPRCLMGVGPQESAAQQVTRWHTLADVERHLTFGAQPGTAQVECDRLVERLSVLPRLEDIKTPGDPPLPRRDPFLPYAGARKGVSCTFLAPIWLKCASTWGMKGYAWPLSWPAPDLGCPSVEHKSDGRYP